MKKFRFPLRTVATVRNLAELRARERFSAAVQVFMEAEAKLKAIRARLAEFEQLLVSRRGQSFRPAEEAGFLEALRQETVLATKTEAEVSTARQALEAARQAWLESRRDVRVIENLETKARQTHAREVERENQAALDDRTNAVVARAASHAASQNLS
ncbi:MAG TPA: flagellar FliJ family protein [Opitutaceae bacterium]|nr:flagellar FliJ family protein [Opitutaceae bacterium]